MFRGNNDEEEDEVIEEFRDSLEERLGIDLDTICHCMYTIALELENKIYTKGGDNDDNNNKEGGL